MHGEPKTIQVLYFALLRERRGLGAETVETRAATPRELYDELALKHRFGFGHETLKAAINDEFAAWDHPLHAGDQVVFITPVAGG